MKLSNLFRLISALTIIILVIYYLYADFTTAGFILLPKVIVVVLFTTTLIILDTFNSPRLVLSSLCILYADLFLLLGRTEGAYLFGISCYLLAQILLLITLFPRLGRGRYLTGIFALFPFFLPESTLVQLALAYSYLLLTNFILAITCCLFYPAPRHAIYVTAFIALLLCDAMVALNYFSSGPSGRLMWLFYPAFLLSLLFIPVFTEQKDRRVHPALKG